MISDPVEPWIPCAICWTPTSSPIWYASLRQVARKIIRTGEDLVCTSIIVACELRYGAAKKGSARLTEQLEAVLGPMLILPLEPDADRHYGALRAHLERTGQIIGANDLLTAAQALASGLTLVTDNLGEFKRVPGLKVRNWLA